MRVLFLESHPMWIHSVPSGFRDAGHEVRVSGPLQACSIPNLIEEFKPDLIMMLGWTQEHIGSKRRRIRESIHAAHVPFVYWATEDPIHTEMFSLPFIRQVKPDFIFTVSKRLVDYYIKNGFPAAYMDFGYHPSVHRLAEKEQKYTCQIAVVANAYAGLFRLQPDFYRFQSVCTLIKPLLQANYGVEFWGWGWKELGKLLGFSLSDQCVHGYLPYTEAYKVYNSADIVIGLQNLQEQVTQRTYEILGSGGLLLTSDTPAVRALFEPNKHLIVSGSPEETLKQVEYYLAHPVMQQQVRLNGQKAVLGHSYKERAEFIIKVLFEEKILG